MRAEVQRDARARRDLANNAVLQRAATASGRSRATRPRRRSWSPRARSASDAELGARFPRVGEVPFTSERKLMSTVHADAETQRARDGLHQGCAGRAAGALHARAGRRRHGPLDPERRSRDPRRAVDRLAAEALRTLGVAYRRARRDDDHASSATRRSSASWCGWAWSA